MTDAELKKIEDDAYRNYRSYRMLEIAETNDEDRNIYREIWRTSAEIIKQVTSIRASTIQH
jgi:hypothetical protein